MKIRELLESKLLDKPTPSPEQIAKKFGVSAKYIIDQLALGIKSESEHTSNKAIAKEIALDHLNEKPDYYQLLKQVEKE